MRTEIISIGTELLLGEIVNTNAQYLAAECASIGLDVYFQTTVGDNRERLIAAFEAASMRADLIICCGGLGPTEDDLTKQTLADFLGLPLYMDETAKQKIETFFLQRNVVMAANNLRQAYLLEGAHGLINDHGLALGCAIHVSGQSFILLPGPPKELKPMFANEAVPWIIDNHVQLQTLHRRMLCLAGIGESTVAEQLSDLISAQTDPTIATYAKEGEVHVRIASKTESAIVPIETIILKRFAEFVYATEEMSLEQHLVNLCLTRKLKIAFAESCTGGLATQLITSIPGCSAVLQGTMVVYSNELKQAWLDVPASYLSGENSVGAVSPETAVSLAEHLLVKSGADYTVSITGVAGPESSEKKPVGLVYLAISGKNRTTEVFEYRTSGTRTMIQRRTAKFAIYKLCQIIKNM